MLREKIFNALFCAIGFALTICYFAPLRIYLTNRLEFPIPFPMINSYFLSVCFYVVLFVAVALLFLPFSIYKKAVSLLLILSFLMWLQGNILVWNYGIFDGEGINWIKHAMNGAVDGIVWVLFISIGLLKSSFIYKIFRKAGLAIILVQLFSLPFSMLQVQDLPSFTKYSVGIKNKFDFSAKKNVILLVIDSFQTVFFQQIIDKNDHYKKIFDGFTYFRNAVGESPYTYTTVPLILTGRNYDNSIPIQDFIKNEFLSNSLPKFMKNNGFQIELYPFYIYSIYFNEELASNFFKSRIPKKYYEKNIAQIYDVALFRCSPQIVKKHIYNNEKWFLTPLYMHKSMNRRGSFFANTKQLRKEYLYLNDYDFQFIKDMDARIKISTDKSIFKYYHLKGMHPPYFFNERLEYEELSYDDEGYTRHAMGVIELVRTFLAKLKEIGAYDNSLIFVVGDHGVNSVGISEDTVTKINSILGHPIHADKGRALPLILVKPLGGKGEMNISDAPVCLSDIPVTVASELGLKSYFPGISMFVVKETDRRERRYLQYEWTQEYIKNDFLPTMDEYVVSGFSWFRESWRKTERKFKPAEATMYNLRRMWGRITGLLTEQ